MLSELSEVIGGEAGGVMKGESFGVGRSEISGVFSFVPYVREVAFLRVEGEESGVLIEEEEILGESDNSLISPYDLWSEC